MADKYDMEVVKPGDRASKLAHQICVESFSNCGAVEIVPRQLGNFRGAVDFIWRRHILESMIERKVLETMQNDGAGGKPQFFSLVNTPEAFYGLGWEILEMILEDIIRSGGFPAVVCNDLNIKQVTEKNFHLVEAAIRGFGAALKKSNVVNITGETAIMKKSITAFCDLELDEQLVCTWGAACLGLSRPDKLIDGSKIRVGNPIVGFWEPGYRCNGGGAIVDVLMAKCNHSLSRLMNDKSLQDFIKRLTIPSQNYSRLMLRAHGWNDDGSIFKPLVNITGIAHITGGGIWGKLGDLLPEGMGAHLNNMPLPAEVLKEAQELSWNLSEDLRITDLKAHGTLHGGCGMHVICESWNDADILIEMADTYGISGTVIGQVTESSLNEIVIESRFREGRRLSSLELLK